MRARTERSHVANEQMKHLMRYCGYRDLEEAFAVSHVIHGRGVGIERLTNDRMSFEVNRRLDFVELPGYIAAAFDAMP